MTNKVNKSIESFKKKIEEVKGTSYENDVANRAGAYIRALAESEVITYEKAIELNIYVGLI